MRMVYTIPLVVALCAGLGAASACAQATPANAETPVPASSRVLLDRVVAVVNNRAILASDLEREMKLSVLEQGSGSEVPSAKGALEDIISRTLIQQQIRREEEQAAEPTDAELNQRLKTLRAELPACVRQGCASDAGWAAFLSAHDLTEVEVDRYLRMRMQILAFIESQFRQGIRITQDDIEAYYKQTLIPQYSKGEAAPTLASVSPRIEEILLERKVNELFGAWLDNMRKQGDIQILDPALETAGAEPGQGGGDA